MPISAGYYKELSDKEYHADPAISSSALVHALRSPAHFWANYVGNPNRIEPEETPALRIGKAAHKYLLEMGDFARCYAVAPMCDRRTKGGKEAWAIALEKATAQGQELISRADADLITALGDALRAFAITDDMGRTLPIADLFSKGAAEESYFWEDKTTGLMLRARTDWRIGNIIIDYKTTRDARPQPFRSEVAFRRYYMRAAMYLDGVEAVTGKRPTDFYFVAQEKEAPYAAAVYRINDNDLLLGQRQYQAALVNIKACMTANVWPAYSTEVQTISVPDYLYDEVV